MTRWKINWYEVRADPSDVAAAKTDGRRLKLGTLFRRVATSIGPIAPEHEHWAGYNLGLTEDQAKFVAAACEAYEAAGNAWPD